MSVEESKEFIDRDDVRAALSLLTREFHNQEEIFARTRFAVKREMARSGLDAVRVLREALTGPTYAHAEDGGLLLIDGKPVLMGVGADKTQISAAKEILNRLGVQSDLEIDRSTEANVKLLFERADSVEIEIENDPLHESEEQRALSRERVRNVILRLIDKVPEARKKILKELGYTKKAAKRKATKKAAKRKTTKKVTKKTPKKAAKRKSPRRKAHAR